MDKKILYVDTSLLGHRIYYLKALTGAINSIALLPQKSEDLTCQQILMHSGYNQKRSLITYLKWIQEIRDAVKKYDIGIVHFLCGDELYRYFALGLSNISVPIVVTYHHMLFGGLRTISLKRIFSKSQFGIVHTEHLKKKLNCLGINNAVQIEYPVFIKQTIISPDRAKKKLNIPQDIPCIACLGGTSEYKGLDILLDALNKVNKPFHLLVAGRPICYSEEFIQENAKKYIQNVTLRLKLLSEDEYECALSAADILVLPYRFIFDGASGPMIEGVWNRKYIVGAGHGSMGEIIRKHHLGRTFETENPGSLADVLNDALSSGTEWSKEAEEFRTMLSVDFFLMRNRNVYSKL